MILSANCATRVGGKRKNLKKGDVVLFLGFGVGMAAGGATAVRILK